MDYCQATMVDFKFVPSASMDHVVSVVAMEYLSSKAEALASVTEMVRVLKPGGYLATVLNNGDATKMTSSMSDKLFQPESWWTKIAPDLGMVVVETVLEENGIFGNDVFSAASIGRDARPPAGRLGPLRRVSRRDPSGAARQGWR